MNQPATFKKKHRSRRAFCPRTSSPGFFGLAFLMVAIMWLTGGKKPPAPAKASPSKAATEAPLEVNETKITELQNRIEELQRQQLVAQTHSPQQTRLLGTHRKTRRSPSSTSASADPPGERAEDPIQAERKRRAYLSLFASNVALTLPQESAIGAGEA